MLPEDLEGVALGVVLEAGEAKEGGVARMWWGDDLVDEVLAGADVDDLAGLEEAGVLPGGDRGRGGACAGGWWFGAWFMRRTSLRNAVPRV